MKWMVTGAYGCIGSWIVKNLVERDQEVILYDLQEDTSRMKMIMDENALSQARFVCGDVSDTEAVVKCVADGGVTHVIHLAGLQVPSCKADPVKGAAVNVLGTLSIFEAAKAAKEQVQRVVYASSVAVYGPVEDFRAYGDAPIPNDAPQKPRTHYGVFKRCNEGNAQVYYLDDGISSIGLRPWTVYGPGRDLGLTSDPTKAMKAAAMGRPFQIRFGGSIDMQFVDDVAKTFIRCAEVEFEGAKSYNLRGEVVSVDTLIQSIERVLPESRGLITRTDNTIPITPSLDDAELQREVGEIPETPLEDGTRRTMGTFHRLHSEGRMDTADLNQ
ncbi:MAG: epimerase [Armatimonadetes bacterium CG2_30_59_28]|nr:SDR family NAD(P)-dependent oxidoreductase [Armatimonadota bacterium]OIO98165.1 MAG: epimerase [Armatimonadetes bacterium CG2_30_59_28]PIU66188.1 MAG: epimerase [Armatimonadetes bacterium CG07_land_8_20_14_0_80_59_28]PIX40407.1 MAG: epimerase [Armatimonadetes bacterium CG_4_8_14_3_um_filter_58_9]PJB71154.1 MAG: epimerase [Armatimonadetes bacterium CG_4_9_14_3_um_filter_58_7]